MSKNKRRQTTTTFHHKADSFHIFSYFHSLVDCCWITKMTSGYTTGGIVSSIHQYTDWSPYPALSGKSGRSCPPDFHPLANKSADETRVPMSSQTISYIATVFFPISLPFYHRRVLFASQWDKCRIEIRYTLYIVCYHCSFIFFHYSVFVPCSLSVRSEPFTHTIEGVELCGSMGRSKEKDQGSAFCVRPSSVN